MPSENRTHFLSEPKVGGSQLERSVYRGLAGDLPIKRTHILSYNPASMPSFLVPRFAAHAAMLRWFPSLPFAAFAGVLGGSCRLIRGFCRHSQRPLSARLAARAVRSAHLATPVGAPGGFSDAFRADSLKRALAARETPD